MRNLLILITIVFFVACSEAPPDTWRPKLAVIVDCDWLSQQPEDHLSPNMNCGPTSLVMAIACIEKYKPEYDDVNALIVWMGNNIDSYDEIGENDASLSQLEVASNGYYDIQADRFQGMSSLHNLYEDLQSGFPVLVAVPSQADNTTDIMKNGNGHFMLLIGITPTHVVLHDPEPWDASLGRAQEYTMDSFESVWYKAGIRFYPN